MSNVERRMSNVECRMFMHIKAVLRTVEREKENHPSTIISPDFTTSQLHNKTNNTTVNMYSSTLFSAALAGLSLISMVVAGPVAAPVAVPAASMSCFS